MRVALAVLPLSLAFAYTAEAALNCNDSGTKVDTFKDSVRCSACTQLPTPTLDLIIGAGETDATTHVVEADGDWRYDYEHGYGSVSPSDCGDCFDNASFQATWNNRTPIRYEFSIEGPSGWGPGGSDTRALPLMVVLHGGCGDSRDFIAQMSWPNTVAQGAASADREFAVLYLEDPVEDAKYDTGGTCTVQGNIHHVGYFDHHTSTSGGAENGNVFVDYAEGRYDLTLEWAINDFGGGGLIDTNQIAVVGHSKGGAGAMYEGFFNPSRYSAVLMDVPRPNFPVPTTESNTPCHVDAVDGVTPTGYQGWTHRADGAKVCEQEAGCADLWKRAWNGRDDAAALWTYFHGITTGGDAPSKTWVERLDDLRGTLRYTWDESGHDRCRSFWTCHVVTMSDAVDPVVGGRWDDDGWDPWIEGLLRKDLFYPAFKNWSLDRDPGGKVESSVCKGVVATVNDTGCKGTPAGDLTGTFNRHLRWRAPKETKNGATFVLHFEDSASSVGIAGTTCDETDPNWNATDYERCFEDASSSADQTVDITPVNLQSLGLVPGEVIRWTVRSGAGWGTVEQTGSATVDGSGYVTLPAVSVATTERLVSIRRSWKWRP